MAQTIVEDFMDRVKRQDSLQNKFLESWSLAEDEEREFALFLAFYRDELHKTTDEMVDSYLFINRMVKEETLYFVRNGRYRYDRIKDVEDHVYHNRDYMEKYMMGCSLSEYLWSPHLAMIRYFKRHLNILGGVLPGNRSGRRTVSCQRN